MNPNIVKEPGVTMAKHVPHWKCASHNCAFWFFTAAFLSFVIPFLPRAVAPLWLV